MTVWPLVVLVLLGGYFDWLLKGQALPALGGIAVALGGVAVLRAWAGRRTARPAGPLASAVRVLLLGVPVAALYLVRWRGTQEFGAGLVTVAIPIGGALALAFFAPRLDGVLAPFYAWRDRVLPRKVRLGLLVALPVVIAFAVAHGALTDLVAFFGATTRSPATPVARTPQLWLSTALTTMTVYLLAREPQRRSP